MTVRAELPAALGVARARTVAFSGIDVRDVDVQVQISAGLPAFTIVGLPDKAVGESRERVRSALGALGIGLPTKRITVNLAPADLQKEGSHFDLPIALALLVGMGALPADAIQGYLTLGELALDGSILPVNGVLPAAVAAAARELGLICPGQCGGEAAWLGRDIEILASANLLALINHFAGSQVLAPPDPEIASGEPGYPELGDIKGQETAKRGLEMARANHHVTYPARFQLVGAMNPCRCGHLDNPILACGRAPRCARDYQGRISGPLFDRIDLHVEVPALTPIEMAAPVPGETNAQISARVASARELQAERFAAATKDMLRTNAEAEGELLDAIAVPDTQGRELLIRATERMHLTARGYHRVLRVARTVADLDSTPQIGRSHIAEALSFRRIAPERRG